MMRHLAEVAANSQKLLSTSLLMGVTRGSSEAYLLRFSELVPHLKPTSVTDPVTDEYQPDRVAPV